MHPIATKVLSFLTRYWLLILTIFAIVLILALYPLGYRPGPGFNVSRVGTLELSGLPDGATVYTDQAKRGRAVGGSMELALVPGTHQVIVDANGEYPWSDLVTITAATKTVSKPILVSKQPTLRRLTSTEAKGAQELLNAPALPSASNPLSLLGGCALVSVSQGRIIAQAATTTPACQPAPEFLCPAGVCGETVVFSPTQSIRSVVAFPGRDDALVVAYGTSVSAIELDPRNPQFFAPLYQTTDPVTAALWSQKSLVIGDGINTFELTP